MRVDPALIERLKTAPTVGHGTAEAVCMVTQANLEEVIRLLEGTQSYHMSKDGTVVVGEYEFFEITSDTPRGVAILLGPGDSATMGSYDGDPQWKGWFPIPRKRRV